MSSPTVPQGEPNAGAIPTTEKRSEISCTPLVPPVSFSESLLSEVANFDCGAESYETEVADWIRAPRGKGGALDDIANNKTQVWLYRTAANELVGYGSLGQTAWRWDNPKKGPWIPIYVIPFLGVQTPFKKQPPGPKDQRYSHRILDDLIYKAVTHSDKHRLLGLCVHPENESAIAFYKRFNFAEYTLNKQGYLRMVLDLHGSTGSAPFPPQTS
jgi:hypothetical protein